MSLSNISTASIIKDLTAYSTKEESSESDWICYQAGNIDFSLTDQDSSISRVSIGNMIIPYDSMIIEYIFLSDEATEFINNKCCEYNKEEVEQELKNFILQLNYIYGRSESK